MYKGFLEKCGFSDYMLEYLNKTDLSVIESIYIVLDAPVSIYTKLEELKAIRTHMPETTEEYWRKHCDKAILNIEMAIELLTEEGIYSVEACSFSEYRKESDSSFDMICFSLDEVKEYIHKDWEQMSSEPEISFWHSVKKWAKNKDGKGVEECEYFFVKDEIIFSEIGEKNEKMNYMDIIDYAFASDLNIPVPFKAGDILEFDGAPFGPKFRTLILSTGDNRDCCCVQGLALNEEGRWSIGAVKHGLVSYSYFPKISFLYAAKPYNGSLCDEEKILGEISTLIDGSEESGRKIWDLIFMFHNDENSDLDGCAFKDDLSEIGLRVVMETFIIKESCNG